MTRNEAIQAMKAGLKITHTYFSADEYLCMKEDGKVWSEDGVCWGYLTAWQMKGTCLDSFNEKFDDGWNISLEP